jgi:hypothetical protein
VKNSFYEELDRVFDKFAKYHMKIVLGDFNAKVGREGIFKQTIGNESLHEISKDNGVRLVNFAKSKNLTGKSTTFPHRSFCKCIVGRLQQIYHILVDKRRYSIVLNDRSFRTTDCETDHYLVVAYLGRDKQRINEDHTYFIWEDSIPGS